MNQLNKKAVWIFFFRSLFSIAILAIFIGGWIIPASIDAEGSVDVFSLLVWIIIGIVVVAVVAYIWARLTYHFYRYELTNASFRKESGVIYKKYVSIPYDRIQNVDIHRGILARILGLSDLQIQTAGFSGATGGYGAMGIGAEGRLPGLSKDDAEELRERLVDKVSKSDNQGL